MACTKHVLKKSRIRRALSGKCGELVRINGRRLERGWGEELGCAPTYGQGGIWGGREKLQGFGQVKSKVQTKPQKWQ